MAKGFLKAIQEWISKIRLPSTLRARIMALIGSVFTAFFILTTAGVVLFVNRIESNSWRGRQLEAARNAAKTIVAFQQRNEDILNWIDLLGYDEINRRPETLFDVLKDYPALLEITVLDRDGGLIANAASDKILLGNLFTIPQSEWFRAARAGQKYYTRVQLSALDEPYLIFSMPSHQGGVMAARVKMDVLQQVVSNIHFGQGGSVFVVTQDGQVCAHTDNSIVFSNLSLSRESEFQDILQSPGNEWYGERLNFKHQRVVSVSTAIGQMGWIVITELPVGEAYSASRSILVALPLILFLLISIAIVLIRHVMVRIFLKSVGILRDGAARIGEGDLDYRMEIPHQDELGEVMEVFNEMAARLHDQRATLEQRVLERTMDLSQLNDQLLREVDDRVAAEEQVRKSLQEKEVLLREIHHRVKNNLQIITSLLSLQSRKVTDAHTVEVLNDSQNRVRSMVLIHEKLYQSDNLAQVDFGEYVKSLVTSLLRSYRRSQAEVDLCFQIEDILLPIESAIPCGLIVNELVTNALKYAFPQDQKGTVWIDARQDPQHGILLRVADDGVGLPPDLDIQHLPTLGLQLVGSLVEQLDGVLEIEQQNGTAFRISFPDATVEREK